MQFIVKIRERERKREREKERKKIMEMRKIKKKKKAHLTGNYFYAPRRGVNFTLGKWFRSYILPESSKMSYLTWCESFVCKCNLIHA